MKIQDIIYQDPSFIKYQNKYHNPMVKYRVSIPDRILNKFYNQAILYEVALLHLGAFNLNPSQFVYALLQLERAGKFTIPLIEGVLTESYWKEWLARHMIEVMDTQKLFCRG